MKNKNHYILFGGILLFIFTAPYIFTRPAFFSSWDLSSTGQIGDTIGGITAPIINLLGALLVYYSFQAQIKANKIQSDALEDEKKQITKRNEFEKYLLSFDEIKKSLSTVEFIVEHPGRIVASDTFSQPAHVTYHGLNAINEYVLRVEGGTRFWGQTYDTFGSEITFQFILKAIIDLIERVELYLTEIDDREFLLREITLFYNGFLKKFAERIIACNPDLKGSIAELQEVKTKIENKIGA